MDNPMAALPGLNRAVPNASLLNRDDAASLGFETSSWQHLQRYVGAVESVPAAFDLGSTNSARTLAAVRAAVCGFGSTTRLRQLIKDRPDVLTADRPPESLYASAAWVVAHLHRSASSVVATLRNFPVLAKRAGDVQSALRQLGGDAEKARRAIGPMVEALRRFKAEIVEAHAKLAVAYKADGDALRRMQEDAGRFDVEVDSREKHIARRGVFGAGKKRELAADLEALRQQQTANSSRSQELQAALAAVEPILNEGFWLETGVDDLIGFLDKLRQVLTAFGSAMTQVAADSSDAELHDTASIAKMLGEQEAIGQWDAIDRAAQRFLAQATADVTSSDQSKGASS
jgi:hypothetical protein